VWAAAIEHHFTLVAARNVFRALDLQPASHVAIDPTVRNELIEGRDLHEHWPENPFGHRLKRGGCFGVP
jgi:hypothetical protein